MNKQMNLTKLKKEKRYIAPYHKYGVDNGLILDTLCRLKFKRKRKLFVKHKTWNLGNN